MDVMLTVACVAACAGATAAAAIATKTAHMNRRVTHIPVVPSTKSAVPVVLQELLEGKVRWAQRVNDDGTLDPFHRKYKSVYGDFRPGRAWYGALDFGLASLATFVGAIRSQDPEVCTIVAGVSVLSALASTIVLIVLQPHVSPLQKSQAHIASVAAVATSALVLHESTQAYASITGMLGAASAVLAAVVQIVAYGIAATPAIRQGLNRRIAASHKAQRMGIQLDDKLLADQAIDEDAVDVDQFVNEAAGVVVAAPPTSTSATVTSSRHVNLNVTATSAPDHSHESHDELNAVLLEAPRPSGGPATAVSAEAVAERIHTRLAFGDAATSSHAHSPSADVLGAAPSEGAHDVMGGDEIDALLFELLGTSTTGAPPPKHGATATTDDFDLAL